MPVLDRILDLMFRHRITIPMTCPVCQGSGYADYAAVPCDLCLGEKTVLRTYRLAGKVSQ